MKFGAIYEYSFPSHGTQFNSGVNVRRGDFRKRQHNSYDITSGWLVRYNQHGKKIKFKQLSEGINLRCVFYRRKPKMLKKISENIRKEC